MGLYVITIKLENVYCLIFSFLVILNIIFQPFPSKIIKHYVHVEYIKLENQLQCVEILTLQWHELLTKNSLHINQQRYLVWFITRNKWQTINNPSSELLQTQESLILYSVYVFKLFLVSCCMTLQYVYCLNTHFFL